MESEQERKARQLREHYSRNRPLLDLQPATILAAFPGDDDGLLPISALNDHLEIEFSVWLDSIPPPGASFALEYLWRPDGDLNETTLHEETLRWPFAFPLRRQILLKYFERQEGGFTFRYKVRNWSDNDFTDGPSQRITIDRTPIWEQVDPPVIEDPGPVNEAVLDADGGVWLTIPEFDDDKKDSVMVGVLWTNVTPDPHIPIQYSIYTKLPESDRRVLMPRALIETLGSGLHHVVYELYDKAGNRSRTSKMRDVDVTLGPVPENLKPPFVPLAPGGGDDLIDLDDARTGVTVEIASYDGFQGNDRIEVTWGQAALPAVLVGSAPDPFPVAVSVPWDHLDAQYTADPDTQDTPVSYTILRGAAPFPLPPADAIKVGVNFAHTGPENPDEPDPVNRELDPVVVRGSSGQDDYLGPPDTGLPATASFKLYNPVTAGDLITVYWNGVAIAHTITLDGSEAPDSEVSFNVLWSEIEAGGMGVVPVHYTLSNPKYPNTIKSPPTEVTVHAIPIVLEAASHPDIADVGGMLILNCSSLRRRASDGAIGVRVLVPASDYLVDNESITLRWALVDSVSNDEIIDSLLEETLVIPADAASKGVEWFIAPYDKHILPAHEDTVNKWAYSKLTYTLTINSNPVESVVSQVIVTPEQLGQPGNTCDITVVPGLP